MSSSRLSSVADASAPQLPRPARSTRALSLHVLVWLGIALSSLGLSASAGWAVWQAYQRSTEAATATTQNLVRILKQHTERTFESVDMLLKIVARELGPDSTDVVQRSLTMEGLAYLTQDVPHVLSLRLLDGKNLNPLFEFVRTQTVGADADRDALEAHASAKYLGLYVGRPLRDPASGAWIVGISRRVTGREGIPGQVVIAYVSLDYLQKFYDKVHVGQLGSVTLVRRDGIVVARRPFDPANVGRDITASPLFRERLPQSDTGTYVTPAVNDGIVRIFSYEALAEVPLVVTVGLAEDEILAAWLKNATRDVSLAGGATVILIVVGSFLSREVRRRDLAKAALRNSEERLRLALQAGRMLALEVDPKTGLVTRSESGHDILGLASTHIADYCAQVHPDDRDKVMAAARASSKGELSTLEFRYIRPDGEVLWLEARAIELVGERGAKRVVGTIFDITSRKSIEETVWRAANYDSLTGLANRSLFQSRLDAAFDASNASSFISLLLIDLDDFKGINDTLGHEAGDIFLQGFAARLQAVTKPGETVARLGGDEFAIIIRDQPLSEVLERAQAMLVELDRPFPFKDRLLTSRSSVGVASYPDHYKDPAKLMKAADMALYATKSKGGHRVAVYSPEMGAEIERRVLVGTEIRAALAQAQLFPFYQPKICLASNQVVGFEALARWKHPERGLLTPAAFAPAFEDHEVAREIGLAMLNQIVANLRTWLARGLSCGSIAINLSPAEFNDPLLADQTLDVLKQARIAPEHLEVEVTESVLLGRRADQVGAILERFHAAGVTIALDDFGTGYASLRHLMQFPVDLIKIDRSFVRDLERDPEDAAIVTAVIGLGKSLNMEVVAEGVETLGQVRFLQEHKCDHAQGYFFAKPLPATRVPWFLLEGHAMAASLVQEVPSATRNVRAKKLA